MHPFALAGADQWAQIRRPAHRVADPQGGGAAGEGVDIAVRHRPGDDVAAGADAGLTLVFEGGDHRARGREVDVGVVEDHEGVAAAEFEPDRPQGGGGGGCDGEAGLAGSGEVQQVQAGVLGERVPRLRAVAGHHVEDARRHEPPRRAPGRR
nr:hypothetical protein [Streptomyces pseudovenezuelae]